MLYNNVMNMYRFLLCFCAAALLFGCQSKKTDVTFVHYNVGVFNKYDSCSVDAVARAVKEMGGDVVSLNELDSCARRTGVVDQIAAFAEAMGGWNMSYASAMPFNGGAYGVGVVSSPEFKILHSCKVPLPRFGGYEPRALAVVEYEDFVFASTHLDLVKDAQMLQFEVINNYVDSVYAGAGKPVFLAGDFNCEPDGSTIDKVRETWTLLTPEDYTYPSDMPRKCIDYIFVRPRGKRVEVVSAYVPRNLETADLATASDHLPVALTVSIR